MPRTQTPDLGFHSAKQLSGVAHRRTLVRPVHKVRVCHDNRPYVAVPFTIPGVLDDIDYGPMWPVDRDYYVARLTLNLGRHSDATHPNDGTPAGQSILANMRRVSQDLTEDDPILGSDARLRIAVNHHRDAINNEEDGPYEVSDFNIRRLAEGEYIYPRFTQVGTTRPGTGAVITAVLVPIP